MRRYASRGSLFSLLAVTLTTLGACAAEDDPSPPSAVGGASHGGKGGVGSGGRGGTSGQGHGGSAGNQAGSGGDSANGGSGDHAGAGAGGRATTGGSAGAGGSGIETGGSNNAGGKGGSSGSAGTDSAGAAGDAQGGAAGAVSEPGGAGGEGGSAAEELPAFVYIAGLVDGVQSLSIDPTSGVLEELTSSPTTAGDQHLYAIASDPVRRFLYTADLDGGHLDAYRIATDGSIPKTAQSSVTLAQQPVTLAVDGAGPFLYVGTLADKSIHIFAIDEDTGALDAEIPAFDLGTGKEPAFAAVDPTGSFLYLSQEFEGGIRGFAIAPSDGALTEIEGSPFAASLVRTGAIAFAPDGAFLFSVGNGLNAFTIEPGSGKLEAVEGSPFTLDVGADFFTSNLAVDPQGDFLYVTSYLSTQHVRGFKIDHTSGALDEVPGSPVDTSAPYSLGIDPAGRFVFVGNDDGHTSVYSLHRPDGKLEEIELSPFPVGGIQAEFAFATAPGP